MDERCAANLSWLDDVIDRINGWFSDRFTLTNMRQSAMDHPIHGNVVLRRYSIVFHGGKFEQEIEPEEGEEIEEFIKEEWDDTPCWPGPVMTYTDGEWDFCEWGNGPDGSPEFWIFLDPLAE